VARAARRLARTAAAAWLLASAALAQAPLPAPVAIDCAASTPPAGAVCSVDARVYVGWRVFHAQCAECHAQDAVGSSFAPDLTRRLRAMSAREFFEALDKGYTGPLDPSPPRGADPDVARYYDELWAYLSARASGALPPGMLARRPNAPRANEAAAESP
jgi:hypothetical protein